MAGSRAWFLHTVTGIIQKEASKTQSTAVLVLAEFCPGPRPRHERVSLGPLGQNSEVSIIETHCTTLSRQLVRPDHLK